jgi:hypothetical protein
MLSALETIPALTVRNGPSSLLLDITCVTGQLTKESSRLVALANKQILYNICLKSAKKLTSRLAADCLWLS